jgi:hypothetical protein
MTKIMPPENTPEYMWPAWAGCLHWASGNEDVIKAFESDTGLKWSPPRNAIDVMIDEATGASENHLLRFVSWFNENIWGDPFGADSGDSVSP